MELATEDVALLSRKMIPPVFERMGYTREEIEKIKEVLERPVVTIDSVINKVSEIKIYQETNEMDVTVDGHTIRLKGKDFLSPLNFQIWAASVLHLTIDITKEEWRAFVQYLVDASKQETEDPLSPNAIDELIKKLKMTTIYDDYCDDLLTTWTDGVRESVLMKDGKLYISSSMIDSIVKKLDINKKLIRDILSPVLSDPATTVLSKKWQDKRIMKRMWIIDWDKLKSYRDVNDIKIIKVVDNGVQTQ